jgi:high-affinity nickel-transport protein
MSRPDGPARRLLVISRALRPGEWARLGGMAAVIVAVNALGWGLFVAVVLPRHFYYAKLGAGLGVAVTAWTLGLRHAFDADHISAIDNVTRKLMANGRRPLGTGFYFALGHSTVARRNWSGSCRPGD